MATPLPTSKLTREEINKYLEEQRIFSSKGRQVGQIPREVLERLIEMNNGPESLDLSELNLNRSALEGMHLAGANLQGARLRGANLQDADLRMTDLRNADLQGANLESASLADANLQNANFSNASLHPEQLTDSQHKSIKGQPRFTYVSKAYQQVSSAASSNTDLFQVEQKQSDANVEEHPLQATPSQGRTFATNDEFDGVDRLDMSKYAKALARLVMMEESEPPLTIGVYGEWGSGKSALMRLIRDELESEQLQRNLPMLLVDFNAWEHAGDRNKLWASLAQSIVAEMDRKTSRSKRWLGNFSSKVNFMWKRTKERWPVAILGAISLAAILIIQAWGQSVDNPPSQMIWSITGLGAIFGSPSLIQALKSGLIPASNRPATSRLSVLLQNQNSSGASQSIIDLIGEMLQSLGADMPKEFGRGGREVGAWPGANPTNNKGLKTIVFIDDLDRCPPDKIVDVLEGIKLILRERQFVVFMAADTRIVSRAIEHRYRHILQSGRQRSHGELGMEYLAKIVQIPFLLPKAGKTELQNLISGRQPDSTTAGQAPNMPREPGSENGRPPNYPVEIERHQPPVHPAARDEQTPHSTPENWETLSLKSSDAEMIVELAHQFTQNPRTYNRLGNELRLMRLLLRESDASDEWSDERGRQLIKWLIMCDRWPAFGQYLCLGNTLLNTNGLKGSNRILEVAKSPEATRLLKSRYDQMDIDNLHAFLQQVPTLSIETVRELVPFTTNLTGIYE